MSGFKLRWYIAKSNDTEDPLLQYWVSNHLIDDGHSSHPDNDYQADGAWITVETEYWWNEDVAL